MCKKLCSHPYRKQGVLLLCVMICGDIPCVVFPIHVQITTSCVAVHLDNAINWAKRQQPCHPVECGLYITRIF